MKNKKLLAMGLAMTMAVSMGITANAEMSAADCADAAKGYEETISVKVGLKDDASLTFEGSETRMENSWMDLYESLGIHLDVMFTASDEQMADKLSQTMISGDYPDVFYVEIKDYKDYVDQGLIADITEYYDGGYASEETVSYLNSDGGNALEAAKLDGKLYGLPQLSSSYDGVPILWIRKDWLNNLGLEAPSTAEEFMEVAKAFTKNDPDGNGQDDTYGFGLNGAEQTGNYSGIPYFFNMYGAMPGENTFLTAEDGSVIWGGMKEEGMKAGLAALSELYAEGCIPADFISDDRAAVEADFTSGKTGMIIAPMWAVLGTYGNALALDINTEIIAVPVPTSEQNPDGAAYLPSATIGYWCVSSKCENPEVLFKIFNLSTHYIANVQNRTQEEQEMYCTGKSGSYTGKALALVSYLDDPANNYNSWKNISAAIESGDGSSLVADQLTNYENISFFLENKNPESYAALSEEDLSRFNSGAGFYSVFGAQDAGYGALDLMIRAEHWNPEAYVGAPTDAMVLNSANLMSYTSETLVNIIMGNQSVDSYSDFLASWLDRGGQAILDEIQAQ
ncbi:MAG: extracellular solute-binding protein [Candidatus Limivivens sp.]|nr:extracellular solute-binding protein [Candidatus Limivivens sp.]